MRPLAVMVLGLLMGASGLRAQELRVNRFEYSIPLLLKHYYEGYHHDGEFYSGDGEEEIIFSDTIDLPEITQGLADSNGVIIINKDVYLRVDTAQRIRTISIQFHLDRGRQVVSEWGGITLQLQDPGILLRKGTFEPKDLQVASLGFDAHEFSQPTSGTKRDDHYDNARLIASKPIWISFGVRGTSHVERAQLNHPGMDARLRLDGQTEFSFNALSQPETLIISDALGVTRLQTMISTGVTTFYIDRVTLPSGVYFARLGSLSAKFVR
jgi:hypothetical protein